LKVSGGDQLAGSAAAPPVDRDRQRRAKESQQASKNPRVGQVLEIEIADVDILCIVLVEAVDRDELARVRAWERTKQGGIQQREGRRRNTHADAEADRPEQRNPRPAPERADRVRGVFEQARQAKLAAV
jgi:hypothetical protein